MDRYELVPTIQYVKENLSKNYVVILKGFAQPISFKNTDFNKEAEMLFESDDFIDEFDVNYVLHIYGNEAGVNVTQILLDREDNKPKPGKRTILGKLYTVKSPAKGGKRKTRRRKQSKRKISRRR